MEDCSDQIMKSFDFFEFLKFKKSNLTDLLWIKVTRNFFFYDWKISLWISMHKSLPKMQTNLALQCSIQKTKQLICCFLNFNLSSWLTQLHVLIKKLITCNDNAFFVCQSALTSHSKAFLCGKLQSALVKNLEYKWFLCSSTEGEKIPLGILTSSLNNNKEIFSI